MIINLIVQKKILQYFNVAINIIMPLYFNTRSEFFYNKALIIISTWSCRAKINRFV